MKRLLVVMALALSGCATTGGGGADNPVIAQVQQIASVACGFLPAAESVVAILALGVPALSTATAIADAICKSLPPPPVKGAKMMMAKPHPPTVAGVVVHGRFLSAK